MKNTEVRVLFINHPECDYGGAFLYNGLVQAFGHKNVIDYPLKESYHGETHRYSITNIPNGMTAPLPWMGNGYPKHPISSYTDEQIKDLLKSNFFTHVVVESLREISFSTYMHFKNEIKNSNAVSIVHEGEDYHQLDINKFEQMEPDIILKREMKNNYDYSNAPCNIIVPFPFSSPVEIPYTFYYTVDETWFDREIDITYLLGNTHPNRVSVYDSLNGLDSTYKVERCLAGDASRDKPNEALKPWHQYIETFQNSFVGISTRGHGYDTCRFWEIPMCCAMFRDDLDIIIPHDYQDGSSCVRYRNQDDLRDKLSQYLNNKEALLRIFKNGFAHTVSYHTNLQRVISLFEDHLDVKFDLITGITEEGD